MNAVSRRWKKIQANMALEGHHISDEELEEVARKYEASGDDEFMRQAVAQAEQTGEDILDVFDRLRSAAGKRTQ